MRRPEKETATANPNSDGGTEARPRGVGPLAAAVVFEQGRFVLYDLAAIGYAAVARRDLNPLRGRLAGLRGLPAMLRKRREIQRRRRVVAADVLRRMAPVEAPWRVLARYRHIEKGRDAD